MTVELLKNRRVDAAIVRFHPMLLMHVAALRLARVPVLLSMQGVPDSVYAASRRRLLLRPVIDWAIRSVASLADYIVVPHIGVSETASELYGISADAVLPNGFAPPSSLDEALVRRTSDEIVRRGVPYVFFAGALAAWQGIPTIIAATEEPDWPSDVRLVIAGGGQLEEEVVRASQESDNILYVGVLSPSEVKAYVQHAILTLSVKDRVDETKNGVTPFKLMESLTYGTPVMVSALPGQVDIVTSTGAGVVVEPGDSTGVARSLRCLVEEPKSELGRLRDNASRSHDVFAWEKHSSTLHSALKAAGL
ncbi:glycosyltransferase [Dietzia kunjamensis]|uniref:glycosyltransferase n=1 Tax=Dietzia kunjamensis TaxID=322509 RepID=UPI002096F571|nr:glycosyltransferase [Dietzia kunjamensis]USX45193.1 glycosyltransferase [Dietzia kunjamensis]